MKLVRSIAFSVALGSSVLGIAACGGTVESPPATSASALTKAPVGANTHGIVKMVGDALGEVPLRPEQRTELEKIATESEARHQSVGAGRKELMLAVADQVEKGTIDRAALQPKIDKMMADAEKVRPDDQAALTRVHALLDAEQRGAFVDALEARFKAGRMHHGGKGAAEHEDNGKEASKENHPHGKMGFLALRELADEMKLTEDQRTQIRDAMKAQHEKHGGAVGGPRDWHAARDQMHKGKEALETFRTPTFDAKAIGPKSDDIKQRVSEGTTRVVGVAETVLPILTPEQRKIAADRLRAMAQSGELPFGH